MLKLIILLGFLIGVFGASLFIVESIMINKESISFFISLIILIIVVTIFYLRNETTK